MAPRGGVLAFDVNETLLDLSALDGLFADTVGDPALRPAWFQTMLQLAFVGGLTERYVDFTTAQHAALDMLAARIGIQVDEQSADRIVGAMEHLPAHPEVPDDRCPILGAGWCTGTIGTGQAGLLAFCERSGHTQVTATRPLRPAEIIPRVGRPDSADAGHRATGAADQSMAWRA